jgi:hypothetical protein
MVTHANYESSDGAAVAGPATRTAAGLADASVGVNPRTEPADGFAVAERPERRAGRVVGGIDRVSATPTPE